MGSVPIVVFAVPVFAAIAILVLPRMAKQMMGATDRRYAEFQLADLAQRMGLHIVEGDPSINMMQAHVTHNLAKGQATGGGLRRLVDTAKETRIRLEGAPYGRPTQFLFFSRTEQADRVAVKIITKEFDCRLSIRVPVDLPPFEIVLRKARMGMKASPGLGLPPQSFGDPSLDGHLALSCPDPRVGPVLAPAVAGLASHQFLHIQGNGDILQSLATETAMMSAMFHIVETQHALEQMANALAGPVSPRR